MKSLRFLVFTAFVVAFVTPVFAGDFGIRAGRYNDSGENFVGVEAQFGLSTLNINPNIEYVSNYDDGTAGSINIDMTIDVARYSRLTPFLGGGLGLRYISNDLNSDSSVVANVIGGVEYELSNFKPYAQIKYFTTLDNKEDTGND